MTVTLASIVPDPCNNVLMAPPVLPAASNLPPLRATPGYCCWRLEDRYRSCKAGLPEPFVATPPLAVTEPPLTVQTSGSSVGTGSNPLLHPMRWGSVIVTAAVPPAALTVSAVDRDQGRKRFPTLPGHSRSPSP